MCLLCVNPKNLSSIFAPNGTPKLNRPEFNNFTRDISRYLSRLNDLANKTDFIFSSTLKSIEGKTDKKCKQHSEFLTNL